MKSDEKVTPLYLLRILQERTDEDNSLTTNELLDILKQEHGIEMHRVTLKKDMELLREVGFGVLETRAKQNQYSYVDRDFDTAELKLMIDAIASSKFVSEDMTGRLISKITRMAGKKKAAELERHIVFRGDRKQGNKQLFYIVDTINKAISKKKKIQFQMCDYTIKCERIPRHGGEQYLFSPYSLVWDNDNYYMVGFSDKYSKVTNIRVDRILKTPEILEEAAIPAPAGFNINEYLRTNHHMMNHEWVNVSLICDNDMIGAIIDRFGPDVRTVKRDAATFWVREEVAAGNVFYSWVFGFGGKVRINGPEKVRQQYLDLVRRAAEQESTRQ